MAKKKRNKAQSETKYWFRCPKCAHLAQGHPPEQGDLFARNTIHCPVCLVKRVQIVEMERMPY